MNLLRRDLEKLQELSEGKEVLGKGLIPDLLLRPELTPDLSIKDREILIGVIDQIRRQLGTSTEELNEDFNLSMMRMELDM